MDGLINRFVAQSSQREALVTAMTSDVGAMPGCRSFVMAHDHKDTDAAWIIEVCDTKVDWEASMEILGVKASIEVPMPLIRDFGETVETEVVAGYGL